MSDADLRDALAVLASYVDEVDLLDRVAHAAPQRRRHRATLAIGLIAAAVAGVTAAAITVIAGDHNQSPAHPSPTITGPLPLPDRLPHYLPPGVTLVAAGPGEIPPVTAAAYHAVYAVNHGRIRFAIIDDAHLRPCHFTRAEAMAHRTKVPCAPDDHWLYAFDPLAPGYPQQVNGETAHVAEPGIDHVNADIGTQAIEWREGVYHYVLSGSRLIGKHGVTGIPFPQLYRMAESVPVDPSVPITTPLPNPPDVAVPRAALGGYQRMNRELLGVDDADIEFDRTPLGVFDIALVAARPTTGADINSELISLDQDQRRASHVSHPIVHGVRATAWTGPADYVGLRYRYNGMIIGFTGRYGVTVADFVRIARAMTVIPHSP
jgi:hypothetical protein